MSARTSSQPITRQIVETLLEYLAQDKEVSPAFIHRLRRLAETGKLADSDAILAALKEEGDEDR